MARRCGLDAGHHVIEYAAVRFCGNENEDRWDSLNDFTHEAIPDWDSPGLIDIFDGKHGAANSHDNKNNSAEFFRDFHHRYQNILQKYGKKAAQTWMRCFYQTKEENVHKLVAEMDAPMQTYVKKLEYSKQFPVFSPDIGSSVYGGFVESMNGADLKGEAPRKLHIAHWALMLAMEITRRANTNKEEADAWAMEFPPNRHLAVRDFTHRAGNIDLEKVVKSRDRDDMYLVTEPTGKMCRVIKNDLKKPNPGYACDCGEGVSKAAPCCHGIAVARKENVTIKSLVAKFITTEGWQEQYREVKSAADVLPTAADIQKKVDEGCIDTSLAIPPAAKRAPGAPKKQGRQLGVLEQLQHGVKRPRGQQTCILCGRYCKKKSQKSVTPCEP